MNDFLRMLPTVTQDVSRQLTNYGFCSCSVAVVLLHTVKRVALEILLCTIKSRSIKNKNKSWFYYNEFTWFSFLFWYFITVTALRTIIHILLIRENNFTAVYLLPMLTSPFYTLEVKLAWLWNKWPNYKLLEWINFIYIRK